MTARPRGFTLVELAMALVVAGILESLAWSYSGQVMAFVRRGEAERTLQAVDQLQVAFYLRHHRFAADFRELGVPMVGDTIDADPTMVHGDPYTFYLSNPNGKKFSYVATAVGNIDRDPFLDVLSVRRIYHP